MCLDSFHDKTWSFCNSDLENSEFLCQVFLRLCIFVYIAFVEKFMQRIWTLAGLLTHSTIFFIFEGRDVTSKRDFCFYISYLVMMQ